MYQSEIGHFSLSVPRATVLALILLRVSCAGEAVFGKSALVEPGRRKAVPVELIVSDAGVTIREKATASTILELSYTAITKLGYSYMDFRRPSLTPLIGAAALFATGKSHWLVVESAAGSGRQTTILRLDKSEYLNAIALLGAKSGKPVEMLAPGSTLLDPTAGSHDQDETVPFRPEQVLAPVKSAMELYSCKVGKANGNRIDCRRPLRAPTRIGGGEAVTVLLEPAGAGTRVRIATQRGLGRDWSLPICREMLRVLQLAH